MLPFENVKKLTLAIGEANALAVLFSVALMFETWMRV